MNPLQTLRKIKGRSWLELRLRGEQAFSVYAEQAGLSGKLPIDADFFALVDQSTFKNGKVSAERLLDHFFENSEYSFFAPFRQDEEPFEAYKKQFGSKATKSVLERADSLCEGRFDLLGYRGLDFGREIDWHFEPISGKRSPLKHWKKFDELSTKESGDKKVIWELNRHQHFFTLGIAYGLTKNERYAEVFAKQIDSWMDANPPGMGVNWASSLEVAFRAISWIWAFHFFRRSKALSPDLFMKALKFLHLHGRHIEKYLSTYYSPNTHLTGEALGLYYLGTQFPFFKRAEFWRKRGREILFRELDRQIFADGGYFEQSTWYQRYTADFYTHFFILKSLNSTRTEKFHQEKLVAKLQALLGQLMYITRPDGSTPLIGDDDGGRCLPLGNAAPDDFLSSLSTGAVIFDRQDFKFIARDFAEESFWLLGVDGLERFGQIAERQPEKKSAAFENSGYFAMRDGWFDTDNFLLVDCGALGSGSAGHGHADALAIDLSVGGLRKIVDSGTYTYHESVQARNDFRTTAAHNTLVIDGESQSEPLGKFSWESKAEAKLHKWISQPRFDFFEGSHNGYLRLKPSAAIHTRSVLFLKNDYWIIRDQVETEGNHDYGLNFHFAAGSFPTIETSDNGAKFVEEPLASGVGLRLFTFGDEGNWNVVKKGISTCFASREETRMLRFESIGSGEREFFTFLLPVEAGFPAPEVSEIETPNAKRFEIRYRNHRDILIACKGNSVVRVDRFSTNFRFLWARTSGGETLPEEFLLIDGKSFLIDGRELINNLRSLEFASGRRFGNQLNIRTSDNIISCSVPE